MTFKLADLVPQRATLKLVHPVHGDLGISLYVVGQDSREAHDKIVELKRREIASGTPKDEVDAALAFGAEFAAVFIVGWDEAASDPEMFGPYSSGRAVELMAMPELQFIKEEVERFVAKRSNFFRERDGGSETRADGSAQAASN